MYKHLMLDLETMGNESFSSIISIGAVEFNIETGKTGEEFYRVIDLQSCLNLGLVINASTLLWWLEQEDIARKELINSPKTPLIHVLQEFSNFNRNKDYQVWGNSARFDCGILQNAYNKAEIPIPWDFRKERCVRTLVSFAPEIKKQIQFKGIKHNAIDDCKYQIEYCTAIWNKLNS